jgi:hypothetical protein
MIGKKFVSDCPLATVAKSTTTPRKGAISFIDLVAIEFSLKLEV